METTTLDVCQRFGAGHSLYPSKENISTDKLVDENDKPLFLAQGMVPFPLRT